MKQTICGGCITVVAIALMIWGIRVIGFNDDTVDFMIVFHHVLQLACTGRPYRNL